MLAPANAVAQKFAGLVNNLVPDTLIPSLKIGKIDLLQTSLDAKVVIDDLVQKITGAVSGGMTAIDNFFGGFDPFSGVNNIVHQITTSLMGTGDTLARLKTFFAGFDPFTGVNSVIKQIGDALSGSGIVGATLSATKDFFTNIRTFLGSINFLTTPSTFSTNLGTNIDSFINSIIKPRGIFTPITDLATYLGGNALADIEKFFKNLSSLFGGANLRTTATASFNPLNAGGQFLHSIFNQPTATINTLIPSLTPGKVAGLSTELGAKAGIADLVQNVTGFVGGTLSNLSSFFAGLPDIFNPTNAATSFVQQFVKQITGTSGIISNISNFFTNVRSFFGNHDFLSTNFAPAAAATTFLGSVLGNANNASKTFAPLNNSGTLDLLHLPELTVDLIGDIGSWIKNNAIDPIVGVLTGGTQKLDLSHLGVWARNLLGRGDSLPAENLIGKISSALLGIIPVSHIGEVTVNLLSQGDFKTADTMDEANGWSWDGTTGHEVEGSAKTSITSALLRELYSNQTIVTMPGDRLAVSAWFKTSAAFAGSSTHILNLGSPTGGSFRLNYNGQTTVAMDRLASAATVQTELDKLITIGGVTVTGNAGGPYTITITGTADKLIGSSSLVGGNLTITSVCPISLAIIPYIGTTAQSPVIVNTAGAATVDWEELAGSTYVVPDDITSVKVRLAVNNKATAGEVWWSNISLTKQGLMKQNLVDQLPDAWTNLWNGLLGRNDTNIGVSDLGPASAVLASRSNTALANGGSALLQIGGLLGDLLQSPSSVLGNIAEVVIDGVDKMGDFLSGLWDAFTSVPENIVKTVADVLLKARALRNDATLGVQNSDQGLKNAQGAQDTADDAQDLATKNAAEITQLKATTLPGAASASDFDNFDYSATVLNPTLWSSSSAVANAGYYRTDGSKAYWVDQGGNANTWVTRFLRTKTTTSYQIITAVLASPVVESPVPLIGSPECYTYLIGRTDATFTNYVYVRIGYSSISIWKKVGTQRIQMGDSASYTPRPGDTVQFLCGTDGGGLRQFQVKVNNTTLLTQTDSTAYGGVLSIENASTNNFGGFGGFGADRYGGQSTPGALSIWSIAENYPDPLLGSGCRVFRSDDTNTANVSSGNQVFPTGWFSQLDNKTSDLSYDSATGRITVSIEGWYQAQLVAAGTGGSFGFAGGGPVRALLLQGGPGLSETPVQSGLPRPANNNVGGFYGVDGNFLIYLKPGEWVRPGYNSTWSTPSSTTVKWTGDTAGLMTWFSLSLTNRSYN